LATPVSRSATSPALREARPVGETPLDAAAIRDLSRLTLGAIRRHPWVLSSAILSCLAASFAFSQILPRSYHAECRLLAQRNLVMPALGNPRRSVPVDSDTPTRGVPEMVLSRDNLVSLIKHTDLIERWSAERGPLLQLKDLILERFRSPPTPAQRLEALIGILEKRLRVTTDETTVTLAIDWPNARTAAELLQAAEDNFLETRHSGEVSTIAETIAILEGHAADVRATIDSTFSQIESARLAQPKSARAHPPASDDAELVAEPLQPAPQLDQHLQEIESREFAEAPIDSPPASEADREREQARSADPGGQSESELTDAPTGAKERRRIEYPKARLKIAFDNYDDLQRRIDSARIELDTAEAAFKYRYRVIEPVVVPRRPSSPNGPAIWTAGGLLGLFLGLFLVFGMDLRGEFIHSAWQLEQRFKIPVLVELREK
jgi:uncharacterized protein involved in exopolysaccharide biosynthesis